MKSSREKRITLRFYLDDPIASETYDGLMQRRLETGAVMNTLIVQLLHRELCQKDAMSLGELEKLFRSVIRSEGRALLREWSVAIPIRAATAPHSDYVLDEGPAEGDDEDDDASLDMATSFCGNLA